MSGLEVNKILAAIIMAVLIVILISLRYFDPFDKGLADWEKCKESLLVQVITNKCTKR